MAALNDFLGCSGKETRKTLALNCTEKYIQENSSRHSGLLQPVSKSHIKDQHGEVKLLHSHATRVISETNIRMNLSNFNNTKNILSIFITPKGSKYKNTQIK